MEEPTIDRQQYRVLVVDDHPATLYAIERGLRASGFDTMAASTGAEGLQLAASASALVLDVNLPDLDGHEVCRILRRSGVTRNLPIVQMSDVSVQSSDRVLAHAVGADAYLTSPVDPKELAQTLERLIASRRMAGPGHRTGIGSRSVLGMMSDVEKLRNPDESA